MECSECKGREWFNRIIDTPPVRGYYDFVLERVPCDCTSGAPVSRAGARTCSRCGRKSVVFVTNPRCAVGMCDECYDKGTPQW